MATTSPSITVFPTTLLNSIHRTIYSGFLEHMGRCIYTGIYDPTNPDSQLLVSGETGFRKDVAETLKPLDIPVFRYPGGNLTETYHWIDGVGPLSSRPERANLAWGGQTEPNTFGTSEFMLWCREHMSAEPYRCLNMGTGSPDAALAWIEYCNGTGDTYYACLRRQHLDHGRPHSVRYWGLGNEVWGPWQNAQTSDPKQYAETAVQWAKAIKLLDPSIKLILCGKDGISAWDYEIIQHCITPATTSDSGVVQGPLMDMMSIHMYTASNDCHENVFSPSAAERAIGTPSALIDLACVEHGVPAGQARSRICFDEWNVWDSKRAVGSLGAEEKYTLSDALATAIWLNVFIRKSESIEMACIAQTVNVIDPLMTMSEGVVKQTSWAIYELFCRFMRGRRIHHVVEGEGQYEASTKPAWLKDVRWLKKSWLDVSVCVDDSIPDEQWCCLAVANLHKEKDLETRLTGNLKPGADAEVYTVSGDNPEVTNMDGVVKVKIAGKRWKAQDNYPFLKHSFTLLRRRSR